jgi:dolichol-phosphate mannosyltransferase
VVYTPLAIFVVANTLLMGLVMIMLGVVSIYIGNIHTESMGRPLYVVRKIIKNE